MAAPLQNSRFQEQLKRLFGFKQDLGAQVIEDIVPVADTHDIQAPESYRLRGENLWAQGAQVTSAAGQAARVQIGFDSTTLSTAVGKLITIVDRLRVQSNTNGVLQLHIVPNLNLTAIAPAVRYRDARSPAPAGVIPPFGFTQMLADAPLLGIPLSTLGIVPLSAVGAAFEAEFNLGVILVPFTRLDISINIAATTLTVFALGRERAMDGSEVA